MFVGLFLAVCWVLDLIDECCFCLGVLLVTDLRLWVVV